MGDQDVTDHGESGVGATIPTTTFATMWASAVRTRGDHPFLVFEGGDGRVSEWTYREFDGLVERAVTRFDSLGVNAERGVHLVLRNAPSFIVAWLAAVRLGSYIVPSDPMATAHELAEHIERTVPAVSVVSHERASVAHDALALLGASNGRDALPMIVGVDEDDPGCVGLLADVHEVPPRVNEPRPMDRAAVMFTSGTTGRPKGVVVTQANYAFAGAVMAAAAELGPEDRQLVVLPMFHANAQYYSFASAIAVGASVALMSRFSASGFVRQAVTYRATHASLFAGPMRMILARGGPHVPGDGEAEGVASEPVLRHCWFAQNINPEQYETLSDWFGCRPRQLYGMTETIPAVLTDCVESPRHDSMGFVTPGCVVDIQDADGRSVPAGVVGEVVVGGVPGETLFAGYLDDPDTTAGSYRNGWFLTGDRARRDEHGRFFFEGRRSDVLKVSGENVSVVEVEAALSEHPAVFDVVVVGAPDAVRDEVPVAFVVPTPDAPADLRSELESWSERRLSKSKRPHHYTFVDELPRTSVGKVRTFILREEALGRKGASEPPCE